MNKSRRDKEWLEKMNRQSTNVSNTYINQNNISTLSDNSYNRNNSSTNRNANNGYNNGDTHQQSHNRANSNNYANNLNNYSPMKNSNNSNNSNNFNLEMNSFVRSNLENKGINPKAKFNFDNLYNGSNNELNNDRDKAQEIIDRKKAVFSNFEQQIKLKHHTKAEDLNQRKMDDEKYLNDMKNYYPFGRSGAGAPNRDKFGNIITTRKKLISDPKYHHLH